LTHAIYIKKIFGQKTKVVFIGPCPAKKNEAARNPELLSSALTFEELKHWLSRGYPEQTNFTFDEDLNLSFNPHRACEGVLYPLPGGMNETLRQIGLCDDIQLISISSLELFANSLIRLDQTNIVRPLFIEALACEGGCLSGPCISTHRSKILMTSDLLRHVPKRTEIPKTPFVESFVNYFPEAPEGKHHSYDEIKQALEKLGKYSPEDEINCSGCGYRSCRDLARALLEGKAEPSMCVSNMRRLATRKATIMIKSVPSAMVLLDKNLEILEVNPAFIRLYTGNQAEEFLANPAKTHRR
jgi:hypothetical protein